MSNTFLINHFAQFPYITQQEKDKIYSSFERVTYPKGRVLLRVGEHLNEFSVIEKGIARSFTYDRDGNDITTNFYLENDTTIAATTLSDISRYPDFLPVPDECIETLTECICWRITYEAFHHLFHSLPGYRECCFGWVCRLAAAQQRRHMTMITETATNRYLAFVHEYPTILQHASLYQIATYLGISSATLSRIRKSIHKS